MQVNIQFNANLPAKVTRKEKWFVAACPILDITSQGDNEEQAKKNLGEAISLFFTSCFERGVLDEVLKDCGFKAVHHIAKPATPDVKKEGYITVPIPFLVDQNSECRV